jgi:hypothetical protein
MSISAEFCSFHFSEIDEDHERARKSQVGVSAGSQGRARDLCRPGEGRRQAIVRSRGRARPPLAVTLGDDSREGIGDEPNSGAQGTRHV